MFRFHLEATDSATGARAGLWETPHGVVETPAFMPVGTRGSVKGLWPHQLREAGAQKILANTYHLALRPGSEVVRDLGGLHRFMNWDGPILTDSGGFQVFSLSDLRRMDERSVVFKSHIDGSLLELSPESAMQIQEDLGADCIMCLDECPPATAAEEQIQSAVDLTTRWAARCRDAHRRADQALFGIVQGGVLASQRERSAVGLLPLDFPGYAIGGLSVGESPAQMYETVGFTTPFLPANKPRYLMGVGRPVDLIECVARGIDLFDCVMPTRNARNATAFTSRGPVKMRNLVHQRDVGPLDPDCRCRTCTDFSRGYIRHLFMVEEMLGPMLLTLHNLTFYQALMRDLRTAIKSNRLTEFRAERLAALRGEL
jgi:queuine tRNA-ribosyltransferase